MWVIAGTIDASEQKNDVWSSVDGVSWVKVTNSAEFTPRSEFASVVFNSKMWIVGHKDEDMWSSVDGLTWTIYDGYLLWAPLTGHTAVVYNSLIWVIAGQHSTTKELSNKV